MMFGSAMLIGVHAIYSLPFINSGVVAIALMIVLGIAVPARWIMKEQPAEALHHE